MDESDFEGTLVLERLAEIGRVEDFFDAIDSDDVRSTAVERGSRGPGDVAASLLGRTWVSWAPWAGDGTSACTWASAT
jgi:hypothetical protein